MTAAEWRRAGRGRGGGACSCRRSLRRRLLHLIAHQGIIRPLIFRPPQILDKDFVLPIGKAKVMRAGKDITITAHSKMVGFSLQAAERLAQEGIDVEVCVCGGGGSAVVYHRCRSDLLGITSWQRPPSDAHKS